MTTDPIEDYLDQLLPRLRGPAARVRRILAETEEHLRDATAEGVAAGLDRDEAAHRAVQRFGDPGTVAGRFPMPLRAVLGELTRTAIALGAVALVAIGLSGGLAELLGHLFGPDAVAGDLPGVTYTAQRCADFTTPDGWI